MAIDKTQFIAGACEQYDERLLQNRIQCEGNIVSALWADPLSISEYNIPVAQFITCDGRFYYSLAKVLRERYKLNEFDEAAVITHMPEEFKEKFDARGGYKSISNLMSIVNEKNLPAYVDEFNKSNLLLQLYRSGFSLFSPIENMNKKTVIAYDKLKNLDYQGVLDWWDAMLATFAKDSTENSSVLEEKTEFTITDDVISKFEEGQMVGTSFGYLNDVRIDDNKPIPVLPTLDKECCSLRHGTVTALAAYSSTGKSMLLCEICLALASRGEKIAIISNEMDSVPYYLNFICFLAYRKFRYKHLTRSKLQSGSLSDEDKKILKQVKEHFNEKYAPNIMFYHISDADTNQIKRICRRAHLMYGASVLFYDTMKADLSDYRNDQPAYLSLIRDSREISLCMQKFGMIGLVALQISSASKGTTWISEANLSQSKQVVEILEGLWSMRVLMPEERDPNSKYFIKPFVRRNNNGMWVKEPYELDPNANYRILFITKNRAGRNSESSNECLLLRADTHLAVFHEEAWCIPVRGYIGAN